MLTPNALSMSVATELLEHAIDNALQKEFANKPHSPYRVFVEEISDWSPGAWSILKPRYAIHWTINEHLFTSGDIQYIGFTPISIPAHTYFPDDK